MPGRLPFRPFAGAAAVALAVAASPAWAQGPVPLHNINFDLWCQEQAHLPPDRCDKRLPEDNAAFEAYVDKIQKYEVPYLEQKQQEEDFSRVILHNDPVDNPTKPSTPQSPEPTSTPPK